MEACSFSSSRLWARIAFSGRSHGVGICRYCLEAERSGRVAEPMQVRGPAHLRTAGPWLVIGGYVVGTAAPGGAGEVASLLPVIAGLTVSAFL